MAQINGTVVSVHLEMDAPKQTGGTYKAWRLIYTDESGQVKNITKPVQGLKFNPPFANALRSLQPNDQFVLVTEKNAQGFIEPKSISKGTTSPSTGISSQDAPRNAPAANRPAQPQPAYNGSAFDNKKQELIVRQSSLGHAIEMLSIGAKKPLSKQEVVLLAEELKTYVYEGVSIKEGAPIKKDDIEREFDEASGEFLLDNDLP